MNYVKYFHFCHEVSDKHLAKHKSVPQIQKITLIEGNGCFHKCSFLRAIRKNTYLGSED